MKKAIRKAMLAACTISLLWCGCAPGASPSETVADITNHIDSLIQITRNNKDGISDFKGECNRFVKAQLDYLQIMPYKDSPHRGGKSWCRDSKVSDGTVTAYGYQVKQIQGANCLDQLLGQYSQPIYNVVVSFDGFSSDAWGHVCYINAIIDNQVYYTDNWTYRGSNLVAFQPIQLDVGTFKKYEESANGKMNALVYFYKEDSTFEEGWDDSQGFWRYGLSNGSYAKSQFIDLGRDKKYYFNDSAAMVTNDWIESDGTWYHAAPDGHMDLGWQKFGEDWYFFNDPAGDMKTNGWETYDGRRYYLSGDGKRYRNTTQIVDGVRYEFDSDGAAKEVFVGWIQNGENWSYQLLTGKLAQNEFVDLGRDKKYYFDKSCIMMVNGWVRFDGTWYHAAPDGHMDLGWHKFGEDWYFFNDPAGDMKTNGWETYNGRRYYLSASGTQYRSTIQVIDGNIYRFDKDGVASEMTADAEEDGKVVQSDRNKDELLPVKGMEIPNSNYSSGAGLEGGGSAAGGNSGGGGGGGHGF